MCVCVRERERERAECTAVRNRLNHGLFANTYKHHHCVCHATLFPFQAWTDAKTKDIINCLYFHFESWSWRLWKGVLHFRRSLWCLREAGHRGPTIMYSIEKIMCFMNIKACLHILLHQIHKIMISKKASYDPFKAGLFRHFDNNDPLTKYSLHQGI